MASSGIWRMWIASETTSAIGMYAAGEIDDPVSGFCQNAGCEDADIAVFTVKVEMAVAVLAETFRIVLPALKGEIDGRREMLLMVVFRSAQVDEKTARVRRYGMQVVDA